MRFRLPLWPLVVLCLLAGSCDRGPSDDARVFRFLNRGDVFTLDLNEMSYGQDIRVTYLIREGLYSPTGPQWKPVPAGATGCDVSPDKMVYTFRLRPEAKWSNGDPVTSADYVFSWKHLLQQPGEYTYLFYYIKGAEQFKEDFAAGKKPSFDTVGIEALDPLTLKVTLKQPVTYFLDIVAFTPFYPRNERSMLPFAPKDPATGEVKRDERTGGVTFDNSYTRPPHVVTNGPFMLTEWKFKRGLKFSRDPHYWDAKNVKLDGIEMVVNDNALSSYLQFRAKAIDWIVQVPADLSPDLLESNAPGLTTSSSFGTEFLTTNTKPEMPPSLGGVGKNPLADIRVRQALTMALDKSVITDTITRMKEEPATHYIPPGTLPGYTQADGLGRDVEKAKQLLADAGFAGGHGFPRMSILYSSENKNRERIAQSLKQQWQATLGLNIDVEGIEGKSFSGRVVARDFAIAIVAWFGDYPDVSTFTDKYRSTSLQNDASWVQPKYDELLNKADLEPNPDVRFGYLREAERLLNTEVPIIPLYHYVNVMLISDRAVGIKNNPRSLVNWKALDVREQAKP